MKKFIIFVPDIIVHTYGRSDRSGSEHLDVNAERIRSALYVNDYHEGWYFPDASQIRVIPCSEVDDSTDEGDETH